MTDFATWRSRLNMTQQAAAEALGLHLRTVQRYDKGDDPAPRAVLLACAYLELRRRLTLLPLAPTPLP